MLRPFLLHFSFFLFNVLIFEKTVNCSVFPSTENEVGTIEMEKHVSEAEVYQRSDSLKWNRNRSIKKQREEMEEKWEKVSSSFYLFIFSFAAAISPLRKKVTHFRENFYSTNLLRFDTNKFVASNRFGCDF